MKRALPACIAAAALLVLLAYRLSLNSAGPAGPQPDTDGAHPPETRFVSIGTGGITGVYYQVGGALMALMNESRDRHGLKVSFQSTGGSVYNINAVLAGDLDVGVAQADRQYQAYHGKGEWTKTGPQTDLRFLCSLYSEAVTLVAAEDAGITGPADLRGKRVNIGNPGSGNRGNALAVLRAAGLDPEADLQAEGVKAAESAKLLQDGRIDAFFYTVGHPAGAITEATSGRRTVRFVPITGMEELLAQEPYYAPAVIPVQQYPKAANEHDVPTIGMLTTLVSSAQVPEAVIHAIVRELFENLDAFRAAHPAFAQLEPSPMATKGQSAPYHPGALAYYRESGLVAE